MSEFAVKLKSDFPYLPFGEARGGLGGLKLKEIDAILTDAIIVSEVSTREKSKSIKDFKILFSKKLGKSMINFYKYSPSFE